MIGRGFIAIGLALLLAGPSREAAPEAPPLIPHPVLAAGDMRQHLSLDGVWHYSIDPYGDGEAAFHGGDPGKGHRRYDTTDVAQAMRDDPRALYECDMARAPTATLPFLDAALARRRCSAMPASNPAWSTS